MLLTSFAYFLFLYIDIRLHVSNAKKALKDREKRNQRIEEHLNEKNVGLHAKARPSLYKFIFNF